MCVESTGTATPQHKRSFTGVGNVSVFFEAEERRIKQKNETKD